MRAASWMGLRCRHKKALVVERRRGSMGQRTSPGPPWAKRLRERCQKWRMATMAEGDEGMNDGSMDPQKTGQAVDQRQQSEQMPASRPGSKAKASGASQSECQTPGVWSDSGEVRVRVGDRSEGGIQRRKRGKAGGTAPEAAPGQPSQPWPQRPKEGGRTTRIRRMRSWRPDGTTGDVCGVPRESRYEK